MNRLTHCMALDHETAAFQDSTPFLPSVHRGCMNAVLVHAKLYGIFSCSSPGGVRVQDSSAARAADAATTSASTR